MYQKASAKPFSSQGVSPQGAGATMAAAPMRGSFGNNPQGSSSPVTSFSGPTAGNGKAFVGQAVAGASQSEAAQHRMQMLSGASGLKPKDHTCEDNQCAEEECDPEECGDETRPPREDNMICGIDKRPCLPVVLVISTVCGAICMMMLQFPLTKQIAPNFYGLEAFFLILYTVTLVSMAYAALCDPGQLSREEHLKGLGLKRQADDLAEELPLPKRSHKTWLYSLPVRRYDHYCKWLTNSIGLLNHREFIVMMFGLVSIAILGAIVDLFLVIAAVQRGYNLSTEIVLFLHLAYSIGLAAFTWPILQLHCGFISRNELAAEWTRNDFYIVDSRRSGYSIPVLELSDDEFNDRFDSFQYDQARNDYDRGLAKNCWNFWCIPRWKKGQLGDF